MGNALIIIALIMGGVVLCGAFYHFFREALFKSLAYCLPVKASIFLDPHRQVRSTYKIGIETINDTMTPLFGKYIELPNKKVQIFSTAHDNQGAITIHYIEGMHNKASFCRSLEKIDIEGFRKAKAGSIEIKVITSILSDGTIKVKAIELPYHYLKITSSRD